MSELLTIPGLDSSSLELLEAAGLRCLKDLALADRDSLVRELERAHRVLKLEGTAPESDALGNWIVWAREQTGLMIEDDAVSVLDHEKDIRVQAMLRSSPLAIPLPDTMLTERNLGFDDIPDGLLLNAYPGKLDVRTDKRIPRARGGADDFAAHVHVMDTPYQSRLDIDVSRLKSMKDAGSRKLRVHAVPGGGRSPHADLVRAPRPETNEGRDPRSRRYVRGVLHPYPLGLYIGAILTLVMVVFTPMAVAVAFLLLLSRELPDMFYWVDRTWLAFPLALPVLALAWLFWGFSGKCRICNQKLFIHRPHRKNAKAHYLPLIGYVIPLCVHMIVFHWFRCSHCGTPVRLKK